MMRRIAVCLVSLVLTAPVWAQEKKETPPASGGSGMQMDIEAFIKEEDALMKKKDFNASLARVDFPVFMATDDSKGVPKAETYDRQQYTNMMKPMFDQTPADVQVTHKLDIAVLSDSLVNVIDNYTMTTGGKKYDGRTSALLVKREGQWKWKTFVEAGWGDMPATGVGGSGMTEDQKKQH
jgi:hypothetical protein